MPAVAPRHDSLQYDGTNGTFICESFLDGTEFTLVSDDGLQLVFHDLENALKTVPLNGWVVRLWNHGLAWYGSNEDYPVMWNELT